MQRMANSLKLDVRYTHSSLMRVYAANLISLQLFIKSQAKNNGKDFFIRYQLSAKLHFKNGGKRAFFLLLSHLTSRKLSQKRKASFGVQGEKSWHLLSVTIPLTSQPFPMKIRHYRKLDTLVYASGHTYVFASPHLYPPLESLSLESLPHLLPIWEVNPTAALWPAYIISCPFCG